MNGGRESRGRTRSLDSDLDWSASRSEPETLAGPTGVDEEKEIASRAVLLVMGGARRGAVHLCSTIAELMRENKRLHSTIEAQRALIEGLRAQCSLSEAPVVPAASTCTNQTSSTSPPRPSSPSPTPRLPPLPFPTSHLTSSPSLSVDLPSPSASSSPTASSRSSGRGSLTSSATPPCLPRLVATPHPHPLIAQRRQQTPSPPRIEEEDELPIIPFSPRPQRSDAGGDHRPEHDGTSRARVKKGNSRETQHKIILRRCASRGPLRGESEEEEQTGKEEGEGGSTEAQTLSQGELLNPRATRGKHRLRLNDRVVVKARRGGEEGERQVEEKKRGAVRFIGPLQDTDSTEVYIGVELDTPCGENDGSIHGYRYFRCEPNRGTFTTITGVRKLSSHSSLPTDTKTPIPNAPSEDTESRHASPRSCSVAEGKDGQSAERRSEMRGERRRRKGTGKGPGRTKNQLEIRVLVHSEPELTERGEKPAEQTSGRSEPELTERREAR